MTRRCFKEAGSQPLLELDFAIPAIPHFIISLCYHHKGICTSQEQQSISKSSMHDIDIPNHEPGSPE
jgi:hypothetical protein